MRQELIVPKKMGGYFVHHKENGEQKRIKNTLVATGASWFLRDIFRKETTLLPDIYYLGLTNATYTFDSAALSALAAGEPSGHGYARQAINRNTSDWTVQEVNGVMQALSKIVQFTASSDWASVWQRAFICDASAGTVGNVIAVSGPAPAPVQTLNGQGPSFSYQWFLRG